MKSERPEPELLHIYPQSEPEQRVYIVGTENALMRLVRQLHNAIQSGRSIDAYFTNDGKHYGTTILCEPDENINKLKLPYTDDLHFDLDPGKLAPVDLEEA